MKNTKKALFVSLLSIVLCLSMLIGSTFAWFTDTATTGVNQIKAGTLDVDLVDAEGNTLVGKTLDFEKVAGAENETILWEPGCTYTLPEVFVVNKGDLALKYQIVISGINGDAKLNEAIEWTIKLGGEELTDGWYELGADAKSGALTIEGHMKEDAGNDYQGLSIDGISITVNATQLNSEYDSFGPDYDELAPDLISVNGETYSTLNAALDAAKEGDTIIVSGNVVYTMPDAQTSVIDFKGVTIAADASNKLATVITFKNAEGSEVGGCKNIITNATIKNVTIVDETFYNAETGENAWEFTYLEMQDVTAENVIFTDGVILDGTNSFTKCTFMGHNNDSSEYGNGTMYGAWVNSGTATFTKCTFVGTRGLKAAEMYGSDVVAVTVDGCTFDNLTEKPGIALDVESGAITIKNSAFINCQAGDQGNYKYESDHDITIVEENNTVEYTVEATTQEALNEAIANAGSDKAVEVVLPAGTYTLPTVSGKDVTISGDKDTVIDTITTMPGTQGAALTFEGVTVNFKEGGTYGTNGFTHSEKVVYKDCVINGTQFLYADAEFINCTFVNANDYSVWTWGAKNVTFTGCTFNDDDKVDTSKAAVETGVADFIDPNNNSSSALNTPTSNKYNLTFTNCTVNGFAVSSEGENTDTKLYANKNTMSKDHLNVVIGGKEVY